ncbi:hypothetical protein ALT785_240123 [Alteromonas infernus]
MGNISTYHGKLGYVLIYLNMVGYYIVINLLSYQVAEFS